MVVIPSLNTHITKLGLQKREKPPIAAYQYVASGESPERNPTSDLLFFRPLTESTRRRDAGPGCAEGAGQCQAERTPGVR
jgi:hypothetical protein